MKNRLFRRVSTYFLTISMMLLSVSSVFAATEVVKTAPINLGTAGDYAILSKTGISTVPNSVITGNIGVSPIDSTAITGFSLTLDATNEFSGSTQIIGKAFAPDYASPTPSNLTTSISNMETAYTDAAGRAADYTELYTGDISGQTLTPGVYKWGTGVLINSDVYLNGGEDDVFIFQIAKGITQASNTNIILAGGVQAKNIFWQAAQTVAIGTGAHFEGIVLGKTNISMGTKASINGRLLAQTAVTLIENTVVAPKNEAATTIEITGNDTIMLGQSESYVSHIYIDGTEVLNKSVKWSLKNQDNSTPVMGSVIENIGNSCTVEIGNESSYVNKYVVLSATLTDDPSIIINKLIQIK
ncbi:MAG: ice-binding family protein [Clostridiaceae bacterium]|nr:ice-binding family protein [Clostridiaceae bacterium]